MGARGGGGSLAVKALFRRGEKVGVGITTTHDPLHGSGRAGFPHPALALGDNAHAAQRIPPHAHREARGAQLGGHGRVVLSLRTLQNNAGTKSQGSRVSRRLHQLLQG